MLKNITINSTVNIYPNTQQNNDKFQLCILTTQQIEKIKNILKKEKCCYEKYNQKEYYYKNLVKREKINENNITMNYSYLEPSNFIYNNNNLITYYNQEKINENEFPLLSEYDRISEKQIESYVFNDFEVIFETENNSATIKIYIEKYNCNSENNISRILAKI